MAKKIEVEIDGMRYDLVNNHARRTIPTSVRLIPVIEVLRTEPTA
jgi:hypothetical protein